ncbi:hypothetical protein [Dialister invisus]|uniref:hypothetical protein n=1 Tax=Dialister invisus TaxID=218538 RepID=UPI00174E7F1C|nr:hypothetical protein [Dialister invisus]HJA66961.1 hypothetical protein [Candidatus Mediterraneibacter cottocaccae]
MTEEAFKKAERIKENIDELEDFMFWCSGRREGERKIPARIIVLKRKMIAGLKSKEFTLPERLQQRICDCVEEELKELRKELENL